MDNYWPYFYNHYEAPKECSDFAEFVSRLINKGSRIVDIGCGNGRDSLFFEQQGHKVFSIDKVEVPFIGSNFVKKDALDIDIKSDVYYCRFFLHTLSEDDCDLFLQRISNLIGDGKLFIETRSSRSKSKEKVKFKSPIGESHYRMLYSIDYLDFKLKKHFSVDFISESNEWAPYKEERPYVIRAIVKKKND